MIVTLDLKTQYGFWSRLLQKLDFEEFLLSFFVCLFFGSAINAKPFSYYYSVIPLFKTSQLFLKNKKILL